MLGWYAPACIVGCPTVPTPPGEIGILPLLSCPPCPPPPCVWLRIWLVNGVHWFRHHDLLRFLVNFVLLVNLDLLVPRWKYSVSRRPCTAPALGLWVVTLGILAPWSVLVVEYAGCLVTRMPCSVVVLPDSGWVGWWSWSLIYGRCLLLSLHFLPIVQPCSVQPCSVRPRLWL